MNSSVGAQASTGLSRNESRQEEIEAATQLSHAAYRTEDTANFQEAIKLHISAAQLLYDVFKSRSSVKTFFSRTDWQLAIRRQIGFHKERVAYLRAQLAKAGPMSVIMLPNSTTAEAQLNSETNMPISLAQNLISQGLSVATPPYTLILNANQQMQHFQIWIHIDHTSSETWWYYSAKYVPPNTPNSLHTMYELSANKRRGYQIPKTILYRVSEFNTPCVIGAITPLKGYGFRSWAAGPTMSCYHGREMRFATAGTILVNASTSNETSMPSSSLFVSDKPDRNDRIWWNPRRFTYGGRSFAWYNEKKDGSRMERGFSGREALFETYDVSPKPGSKTGKKIDKDYGRRLAIYNRKMRFIERRFNTDVADVYLAADMDQMLKEFLLADILTKLAVNMHGNRDR